MNPSSGCPGQDRKKLEEIIYEIPCPGCSYKIEFFYDDKYRNCPKCTVRVELSDEWLLKNFGCAAWCKSAENCLGYGLYSKVKDALNNLQPKSPD